MTGKWEYAYLECGSHTEYEIDGEWIEQSVAVAERRLPEYGTPPMRLVAVEKFRTQEGVEEWGRRVLDQRVKLESPVEFQHFNRAGKAGWRLLEFADSNQRGIYVFERMAN
ncbi:hypothetical protein E1193_15210 [Micromonospora sp. KC606]|uniref:hypothetical protein n=1 Tax=Micromonospora sp. KC606 TaxID=2530379 RepID=UPI00104594FA|nr:hypothetical protein [Micromonospora sp. KC606]TDC81261.1 hypothetical protein E1193_15210 [Micromonospora sp. KC606]